MSIEQSRYIRILEPVVNPLYPNYVVYPDGRVFSNNSETFLKPYVNKEGYYYVQPTRSDGRRFPVALHVVIASTYVRKPKSREKLQVNHIDGNRGNNIPSNLEWVTPKENVDHRDKLRRERANSECVRIELPSYEVTKYETVTDLSRQENLTIYSARQRVKTNGSQLFDTKYVYTSLENLEPILRELKAGIIVPKEDFGRGVKCVAKDVHTGEITHFEKIEDLADFLGVKFNMLYARLTKGDFNIINDTFQVKFDDDTPWPEIKNLEFALARTSIGRAVCVLLDNGERLIYSNLTDCCKEHNIKKTALCYRLSQKGKNTYDGKRYLYLDDLELMSSQRVISE